MTTAPLVPADVDLRDFTFMPLDVARLRDSKIVDEVNGEAFRAAVLLWCAAWHQVPASSLPNDDVQLAKFAVYGRVVSEWLKVKDGALYGFVLCSDGRLYHPVVAEKAVEASEKKAEYAERSNARTEKARAAAQARWGKGNAEGGGTPSVDDAHARDMPSTLIAQNNANASGKQCGGMLQALPKGTGTGRETRKSSLRSPRGDAGASAENSKQPLSWSAKANLDRVEQRCRTALDGHAPDDLVIGPVARLEADGFDLDREIIPAMVDAAMGARRRIRTWQLLADKARERIGLPHAKAQPASERLIDPDLKRRAQLSRAREYLLDGRWGANAGPRRGEPGCRIPEDVWEEAKRAIEAEKSAWEESRRAESSGFATHH
jgi:hypothetical protein